jgi:hypothetical protein
MNRFKVASLLEKGEVLSYSVPTPNWRGWDDKRWYGPARTVEMQCLRNAVKITVRCSRGTVIKVKTVQKNHSSSAST